MIYERTLAEIDDQLEGWAKVEALHVKKEAKFVKIEIKEEDDADGTPAVGMALDPASCADTHATNDVKVKVEPQDEEMKDEEMEDSEDEEEEEESDDDFDELLDWRSKGT